MRRNHHSDELWVAANRNVKARQFWLKKLSGEPVKSHFPYDHENQGRFRYVI